jgi:putative transposase
VRLWLQRADVKTLFIEPGGPRENGYVESFNGKLRDELLNGETSYTLKEAKRERLQEAKVLVERWRKEHNELRWYSSLGYRPQPGVVGDARKE